MTYSTLKTALSNRNRPVSSQEPAEPLVLISKAYFPHSQTISKGVPERLVIFNKYTFFPF